jgi:hypothetical protein
MEVLKLFGGQRERLQSSAYTFRCVSYVLYHMLWAEGVKELPAYNECIVYSHIIHRGINKTQ